MTVFYWLFSKSKFINKLASSGLYLVLSIGIVAAIITLFYSGFAAPNPFKAYNFTLRDAVGDTNFEFYFRGFFIGGLPWSLVMAKRTQPTSDNVPKDQPNPYLTSIAKQPRARTKG